MKLNRLILASGIMLGGMTIAQATVIGFGQLGGNNTTVPASLGSNATADGSGYTVSIGGATPNIGLTWDANWDIHTSTFFGLVENTTVGGGAWDNEGSIPRVGQLDFGNHTISLTAAAGYALVLNSFDFGLTAETSPATTAWDIMLTDSSSSTVVWSQSVAFSAGNVVTVTPNFTGIDGGSYLLTFNRTSESFNSNGRHGIDNFSFSQVAVPEPSTYVSLVGGGIGLLMLARRKKA